MRIRRFLEQHPRLAKRIFAAADEDGNGVLDPTERKRGLAMLKQQHRELAGQREERRDGRQERRQEWRDEHREKRSFAARRQHDRLDRNDNGRISPREWNRAKKIHDRMDRNDDGRVGPRERKTARRVRKAARPAK
jgi:hypothetical protein